MNISLISMDPIFGALGLRTISSCLKQEGHVTKILFMQEELAQVNESKPGNTFFSEKVLEATAEQVEDAELIGLSCMAIESNKAFQLLLYLKKLNKPIIWGGIYATSRPDECLKHADIICIGEGEEAICELVSAMEEEKNPYNIKNLWFKNDDEIIIKNPVRPLLQDLDTLPLSDYDTDDHFLLEGEQFKNATEYYQNAPCVLVHTTRGCPLNCSYCCNSLLQKIYDKKNRSVRRTSVDYIMREIEQKKKIFPNLKMIWFTDDTFFIRPEDEIKRFAEEYKVKGKIPFQCYTTPSTMTERKLEMALDAGMLRVEMGIQSGSEHTNRDIYFRNIKNSTVKKAAQLINKYQAQMVPPNYQIIFQNPFETESDLLETISFLLELPAPFVLQVFPLTFFPGTDLYEKAKSEGQLQEDDFASYFDYDKKFELEDREKYLNFLIYLMSGLVEENKVGKILRSRFPFLKKKWLINHFKKHPNGLNFLVKKYFELTPLPQKKIQRFSLFSKIAFAYLIIIILHSK